jgi:succinoglycan biosynthesis protein ExoO
MRFVFLTDELPRPGFAGHLTLNFTILSWLASCGHDVTVLLTGTRVPWAQADWPVVGPHVRMLGGRVVSLAPKALARAMAPTGWRRGWRVADAVLGAFVSAADAAWCARYVAGTRPDGVLVDTIFRAPALAGMAGVNSVLIAHDVLHRRHAALRAAGYQVRPPALSRADEAALAGRAAHIAAIQPAEARLLAEMCPARPVFVCPMPARPCPPPVYTRPEPGRLVFVGSDALPNLDGLRWFLREVFPALRAGGVTLDLIGDCGAAVGALPPGVTRHGRVDDLAPRLHKAALAIAPLLVGSGLKIKILDYARHGLVTIATPAALEGFATDPASPFVSAGPEVFGAAIIAALARPAPPEGALGYVARHYGIAASFAPLGRALGIGAEAEP